MNYQAIYRNPAGVAITNFTINVEYLIHQGSPTGTAVYIEDSTSTTNQFGLFTHAIGTGVPVTGTFSGINWGNGSKYLEVKVGGNSLGTAQLLSVPYALYAAAVASTPPQAPTIQKFLVGASTGTYAPPAGVLYIKIKMVGGGGGGQSAGGANGGNGGNTTFGGTTLLAAYGGAGSIGGIPARGTASIGAGAIGFAVSGGSGTANDGSINYGGNGGNSALGGGGGSGAGTGSAGAANTGGGGGGANNGSTAGGGGGGGAGGYVEAIITNPTSYQYVVGAGGTGGGAAGGTGAIIVEEYYQ